MRGGILRLNKLAEAEAALQKSLALPASAGRFRAETLYDLACVYARQDRGEDCRQTLLESAKLKPLDKKCLAKDADLKSIRNQKWFHKLLAENMD